jgi:hypothetical protein
LPEYSEAAALGWRVLPVSYAMLREGVVPDLVRGVAQAGTAVPIAAMR